MENILYYSFNDWLKGHGQLSTDTWMAILQVARIVTVGKDSCILKNNHAEKYFRYIYSGVIKSEYHCDECCFVNKFYVEKACSYYRKLPSDEDAKNNITLTSVTPVVMIEIRWSECVKLFYSYPEMHDIALSIMKQTQLEVLEYINELRLLTAEERYLNLLRERRSVVMNAKMEDIASYLNITPSTFSRVRKATVASHHIL